MRQFLVGLAIALVLAGVGGWLLVRHTGLVLVGPAVAWLIIGLAGLGLLLAWPLGYAVIALCYALRRETPAPSTSYSIEQGREVDSKQTASGDD